MMSVDLGIDLGTASVLVYVKGKGVVLKEPSVVAFDRDTNVIKAIGEEARLMLGRTPGNIIAVRPLRQGVISDYTVTEKMIKYFVQKALGKRTFKKPRISICVPSGVTEVEKKAVEEATFAAGAREVHLIEEPVAAAIGAGIDISKPCGNMIVDIGGGTADIAVISLGGTVVNTSIKIAGDDFDEAIVRYMRKKHNLLIGERTAEDIRKRITLPEGIEIKAGLDESLYSGADIRSGYTKACKSLLVAMASNDRWLVCYNQLTLGLFVDEVSRATREEYVKRIFAFISDEEIAKWVSLLEVFYRCEGSITETASELFIHKNTLQYQLKKLASITGYDPRSLSCAGLYQTAIKFFYSF